MADDYIKIKDADGVDRLVKTDKDGSDIHTQQAILIAANMAVLEAIQAAVEALATALPGGTNNIGDVDVASLPVDGDGAIGSVKILGVNAGTYYPLLTTDGGVLYVEPSGAYQPVTGSTGDQWGIIYNGGNGASFTPTNAIISASSSGNNTIVAANPDLKIMVLALSLSASAAVNVKFQSGAGGTDITGLYYLAANGGMVLPYNKLGWFETAASALLNLNLSGAVPVGGCITYIEV